MERRKLYKDLVDYLPSKRHTILVGPRQTGKTTLLKQVMDYCKVQGFPVVFLDLEHKDIRAQLNASPDNVFLYCPVTEQRIYIFIDEIQKLNDPSNFLKQLFDDYPDGKKIKITATGSSAFYIDDKFNDSLAGRKKEFNLYTCTFTEYLLLGGKNDMLEEVYRLKENPSAKSSVLPLLQNEFYNYIRFGGYPEVVTEPSESEKIEILKDLRDSFVKKDIDEAGVKDIDAFYGLFQVLAIQAGGLTNNSELGKILRIKDETIAKYLDVMEKCFHIARVKPFHRNLEKELVKMPVTYLLDSGMRNVLMNNFQPFILNPDQGKIWENQAFRLLVDKYGINEIRFWRTTDKKEVDFVLPDFNPPLAYEVKKSDAAADAGKYKTFREAYPEFNFRFLCLNPFNEDFIRMFI